jgi:hypothetical protein
MLYLFVCCACLFRPVSAQGENSSPQAICNCGEANAQLLFDSLQCVGQLEQPVHQLLGGSCL